MVVNRLFEPVRIVMTSTDAHLLIDSVDEATKYLTETWPAGASEALEDALQACIDGLNDRISPTDVRQAFLRALNEAGIAVDRHPGSEEEQCIVMRRVIDGRKQ